MLDSNRVQERNIRSREVPRDEIQRVGKQVYAIMESHDPERFEGVTQASFIVISALETDDEVKLGALALTNSGLDEFPSIDENDKLGTVMALGAMDVTDVIVRLSNDKVQELVSKTADLAMAIKAMHELVSD
jgi:hypothetical protein